MKIGQEAILKAGNYHVGGFCDFDTDEVSVKIIRATRSGEGWDWVIDVGREVHPDGHLKPSEIFVSEDELLEPFEQWK